MARIEIDTKAPIKPIQSTTYIGRNYAGREPHAQDGDTFLRCNLSQAEPNTAICKGVKGLTFERCNLARAVVPKDAKVISCNRTNEPRVIDPPADPPVHTTVSEVRDLVDRAEAKGVDRAEVAKWRAKLAAIPDAEPTEIGRGG